MKHFVPPWESARIIRLRSEHPDLAPMSDFVVKTAGYVISAMEVKAMRPAAVPDFVSAPVGAGKTTGALLGLAKMYEEDNSFRGVMLTPYIDHAEALYRQLVEKVGMGNVCVWTSKHDHKADSEFTQRFGKDEVRDYPIAIICHQAVQNPDHAGFLGRRDLWVYDEMPENIRPASLTLASFAEAWSWAENTGNVDKIADARSAHAWATVVQDTVSQNYDAILEMPWVDRIAAWDMLEYKDTHLVNAVVSEVVHWCKAVQSGMGFVSRKTYGKSRSVTFNGALCELPDAGKTVILSASAWVSGYNIAPDKYTREVESLLPVSEYRDLNLVHLDPPKGLPKYYKSFASSRSAKDKVTKFLKDLIAEIPDDKIFLTCPKAVQPIAEAALAGCGKEVHISHHGIGTGSNEWRECTAVVYFLDHFIPAEAHVNRKHAIVGDKITDETLEDAQHYLRGQYADIKKGHHLASMMQLVGRGCVRVRDDDGKPEPMTAYMVIKRDLFDEMQSIFPKAQMTYQSAKPTSKRRKAIHKVADWLREHGEADVGASVLDEVLKTRTRKWSKELKTDKDGVLAGAGYRYEPRKAGRYGKEAQFVQLSH